VETPNGSVKWGVEKLRKMFLLPESARVFLTPAHN